MWGSSHPISGLDVATGTFVLMIISAVMAVVVLAGLIRLMVRRAGQSGTGWVAFGLVLAGGMISYALVYRVSIQEQAADRRSLETRLAELTVRSLAPGSALGCLDAVASVLVENACERLLFASPEAVAAAVEYVDARFSLLASSAALARSDASYQPMFERLRRGLEADRYGLVAHVLMTRGCNAADCAEIRLLRDPARVVANMQVRAFETSLGAHALAWPSNGSSPAVASATPSAPQPPSTIGASTAFAPQPPSAIGALAPAAAGGSGPIAPSGSANAAPAKFDFPSASSIPAVNIMASEPGRPPPAAESKPGTPAPTRAALPPRRQGAREAAVPPPPPTPAAAPAAPLQVAPEAEAAPEPAAPPLARPDRHSTH
jgi:hypothetical protein